MVLNCSGRLLDLQEPVIMGIVNLSPDSFFDGKRGLVMSDILQKIEFMVKSGAGIIDIGPVSTRPGSVAPPVEVQLERMRLVPDDVVKRFPQVFFSVDSYEPTIVRYALDRGWHIINDIKGGRESKALWHLAKDYGVAYILMHMQGMPHTMQDRPEYQDVTMDILSFFVRQIADMHQMGLYDIIIDPGFGFGKSIEDNYTLLKHLSAFQLLELPILVGLSRKSMVYKVLDSTAEQVLPATSALHLQALMSGAKILRVHDVDVARQMVKLYTMLG